MKFHFLFFFVDSVACGDIARKLEECSGFRGQAILKLQASQNFIVFLFVLSFT